MEKTILFCIGRKKYRIKAKVCKSIWSKAFGMMFKFRSTPLFFVFNQERKIRLHMLFVFFPISAIFFNKKMKIVKVLMLKPFSFSPAIKAKYVLEVPAKELI